MGGLSRRGAPSLSQLSFELGDSFSEHRYLVLFLQLSELFLKLSDLFL